MGFDKPHGNNTFNYKITINYCTRKTILIEVKSCYLAEKTTFTHEL